MATPSVTAPCTTTTGTEFRAIPSEGRPLLAVLAGVTVATARREAADLVDAVRGVLASVIETGTEGRTVYLCEFALETARALREATGCGRCGG